MNREKRKQVFEKLSELFKTLPESSYVQTGEVIDLFEYVEVKKIKSEPNVIEWHQTNTAHLINKLLPHEKSLVLIFGSAHKAGGGVVNGAAAQEEDISLHTTWYFQVKDNNNFYKLEHKDYMYSDFALYTNKSVIITNEYHVDSYHKPVSLISIAAPNIRAFVDNEMSYDEDLLYKKYEVRLMGLMNFAEHNGHKTIVLGAWGCGVFGLSVPKTASIMKRVISESSFSGKIVFSILDEYMFNVYQEIIK